MRLPEDGREAALTIAGITPGDLLTEKRRKELYHMKRISCQNIEQQTK